MERAGASGGLGVGRFDQAAALQFLQALAAGLEQGQQSGEQGAGLGGVVGPHIAHVDIEAHGPQFGPGVHAQMRFGQQHRGGHTAGAGGAGRKRMHQLVDRLQPTGCHGVQAGLAQRWRVLQPVRRTAAVVQISGQVKAKHKRLHFSASQGLNEADGGARKAGFETWVGRAR